MLEMCVYLRKANNFYMNKVAGDAAKIGMS